MRQYDGWITASDLLEYLFCPPFIYFMYCLEIAQREEKRYKVLKGREIHLIRERINKSYLRKKLGVIGKLSENYLQSHLYKIDGKVDEILFLENGSAAPLDYKFAEYKGVVFPTYLQQSAFYGLMIREIYNVEVSCGFICYTRSKNRIITVELDNRVFDKTIRSCNEIHEIISQGKFPKNIKRSNKCVDCTYRNICPQYGE